MTRALALFLCSVPAFAEQEALLLQVRSQALEYVRDLDNFTCTRVMERHRGEAGKDKWKLLDTTEDEITASGGRERVVLMKLNGKPAPDKVNWKWTPYRSAGDFTAALRWIFDPAVSADFVYKGTEGSDHIWEYRVRQSKSAMRLKVNDWVGFVPFFGWFRVDGQSARIRQLRVEYSEPEGQPVSSVKTLTYALVPLGGREFLLPAQVEETVRYRNGLTRIRSVLTNYRRFDAHSTITPGAEVTSPSTPRDPGLPVP